MKKYIFVLKKSLNYMKIYVDWIWHFSITYWKAIIDWYSGRVNNSTFENRKYVLSMYKILHGLINILMYNTMTAQIGKKKLYRNLQKWTDETIIITWQQNGHMPTILSHLKDVFKQRISAIVPSIVRYTLMRVRLHFAWVWHVRLSKIPFHFHHITTV